MSASFDKQAFREGSRSISTCCLGHLAYGDENIEIDCWLVLTEQPVPKSQSSTLNPGSLDSTDPNASPTPTPQSILDILHNLPPSLTFAERTTTPTSNQLFGSITLGDVTDRLVSEYKLDAGDVEVVWRDDRLGEGSRVKELGEWAAEIRVRGRGREELELGVKVERLEG